MDAKQMNLLYKCQGAGGNSGNGGTGETGGGGGNSGEFYLRLFDIGNKNTFNQRTSQLSKLEEI